MPITLREDFDAARHRIEAEPRGHFGDAPRSLGDDHEVNGQTQIAEIIPRRANGHTSWQYKGALGRQIAPTRGIA